MLFRSKDTGYLPARPLDRITAQDILQAVRAGQGMELATREDPGRAMVRDEFERIAAAERAAGGGVTLQDLVNRVTVAGESSQADRGGDPAICPRSA